MNAQILAAIVGLIGGGAVAFFVAVRRFSGRIATTEAEKLWDEAGKIRDWQTGQLKQLRDEKNAEITDLRERLSKLEQRNEELHAENGSLQHTVESHEQTIGTLRSEVEHLRQENAVLKADNQELRVRLDAVENGT